MARGDRGAFGTGGWLSLAPILLIIPFASMLPLLRSVPVVLILVCVLLALWLALSIALIRRSVTPVTTAASGPAPGSGASAFAMPQAGAGPHDPTIALAFRWVALASVGYAAYTLVMSLTPQTPDISSSILLGVRISAGAWCLIGLVGAWLLPPAIMRGDLRVIRPLSVLMLILAAPSALLLLLSALNPFAMIQVLFSVAGFAQIAWVAMTGVLLVRGFTPRLN
jgi:hypothetical protein